MAIRLSWAERGGDSVSSYMLAEALGDLFELVVTVLLHGAHPLFQSLQNLLTLDLSVRVAGAAHLLHP